MYETVKDAKDIEFTYEKEGFAKGDARPEMYYECQDITDPADIKEYHQKDGGQYITYMTLQEMLTICVTHCSRFPT